MSIWCQVHSEVLRLDHSKELHHHIHALKSSHISRDIKMHISTSYSQCIIIQAYYLEYQQNREIRKIRWNWTYEFIRHLVLFTSSRTCKNRMVHHYIRLDLRLPKSLKYFMHYRSIGLSLIYLSIGLLSNFKITQCGSTNIMKHHLTVKGDLPPLLR